MNSGGIAIEEVLFRRLPDAVTNLGWSRHGELAILLADGSVLLTQDDVILGTSEISDAIALAWEPSGEHLAVVDHDGEIALWSRGRGWRPLASLPGFGTRLTWSTNGRLAASAGTRVLVYDFAGGNVGEPPTVLAELPAIITDLAWRGPDHLCVATLLGTWALDCHDGDRAMVSEQGVASLSLSVAANGALGIGQAAGRLIVRWSATEGRHLDGYAAPLWHVAWSDEAGMCSQ